MFSLMIMLMMMAAMTISMMGLYSVDMSCVNNGNADGYHHGYNYDDDDDDGDDDGDDDDKLTFMA